MLFAVLLLFALLFSIGNISAADNGNVNISTNNTNLNESTNQTNNSSSSESEVGIIKSASDQTTVNSTNFTRDEIKSAASRVRAYVEMYYTLPNYVQIGSTQVSMPQFLELLTTTLLQINAGNTNPVTLKSFIDPANPQDDIRIGNIYKSEYLKIASDVKSYMDSTGKTPDYAYGTSLGAHLGFQNLVYMYSMILDYYNTSGKVADWAAMVPWGSISSKSNFIIPNGPTFTINQIKTTASTLRVYIEANSCLPSNVTVNGTNMTISQFLELLTTALLQINSGNNNPIPLRSSTDPVNSQDDIKVGNIYKSEYLKIASDVKSYMDSTGKTPDYAYGTSLGAHLGFQNLVYMYTMILQYYNASGRVADWATMRPWAAISKFRPVYVTSDNIINTSTDTARINAIVNGLKALGLNALNWGLGPNTHYSVLQSAQVPANTLVVDIYGGACAGTIYEMGLSYYKNLVGTRKVFSIWIPPSVDITGLAWLPRAHDDNFSPANFTGLANPDQYLLNNGYHYMYSSDFNRDLNSIISHIYNEAKIA